MAVGEVVTGSRSAREEIVDRATAGVAEGPAAGTRAEAGCGAGVSP
jgi:hypothetical protein